MTISESRDLSLRWIECIDRHDLEGAVQLASPGCTFHGFAPEAVDRQGFLQAMRGLLDAFPDARFRVDEIVAEGDVAANRHQMIGTHTGAFQGVPASGRQVHVQGMDFIRVADGAIQEFWLNADFLGLLMQIGGIPQPEGAAV